MVRKKGRWWAYRSEDFIGWEVKGIVKEQEDGSQMLEVKVANKVTHEERVVTALATAIPLGSIERFYD